MATSRKQASALGVLILILVATIWWQRGVDPGPEGPPSTETIEGQPGAGQGPLVTRTVPVVALSRLKREATEPSDTGRDPFSFGAGGPGKPRPGGALPPPAPTPVVQPIAPAVPAGPPPPPPIPLKFIAVFSKAAGTKIAMLTDGRGVYYGAEGAVIEGQYRIVRIRMDSIEMTYLDGRGRRTIPLSGS